LANGWAADHTTNVAGGRPIVVLDMYEHAYHMDYGAKAAAYVDAFMKVIRWDTAAKRFGQYSRGVKREAPSCRSMQVAAPCGGLPKEARSSVGRT
jgi:hypothetical protein